MRYHQRLADFNESTYATFVTSEVTRWLQHQGDLTGVPITPTLTNEAELGYDVALPARWGMVYLQYKLAEFMRGGLAREYHHLGHAYFRFAIKTNLTSNGKLQHNTLCDLEDLERAHGGLVFYAAPIFLTQDELFAHLSSESVVDHSVFASPGQLGPVVPGAVHRYTYTSPRDVQPFSEPGPERVGAFEVVASSIRDATETTELTSLVDFLDRTAARLRALANIDVPPDTSSLQQVARFSLVLGVHPFLLRLEDVQS